MPATGKLIMDVDTQWTAPSYTNSGFDWDLAESDHLTLEESFDGLHLLAGLMLLFF